MEMVGFWGLGLFFFFSVSHLAMHPNPSSCQKEENRFTFSQAPLSSLKVCRWASRPAQEKLSAIFFKMLNQMEEMSPTVLAGSKMGKEKRMPALADA